MPEKGSGSDVPRRQHLRPQQVQGFGGARPPDGHDEMRSVGERALLADP